MTSTALRFPPAELPESALALRDEVRQFVRDEIAAGTFEPQVDSWLSGISREFSQKLGQKGWLGMSWSKKYGGHDRSLLDRFVVSKELLAAGAPVGIHWAGDRQTGPMLETHGTEFQKQKYLPAMAKGECFFALGLSEPDAGSDLANVRTRATRTEGGWLLNGSKIWSSAAHHADAMVILCRTSAKDENNRHDGISQLMVDTDQDGITIRPIHLITGVHHFNEVFFEDTFVPDKMVVGDIGGGWSQVVSELGYERSGPERFLSTFPLFLEFLNVVKSTDDQRIQQAVGSLTAKFVALYNMSIRVMGMLSRGERVDVEAALVKDQGTIFEGDLTEALRSLVDERGSQVDPSRFEKLLATALLHSPGFTLRGGTNEILRGMIARGLGLR